MTRKLFKFFYVLALVFNLPYVAADEPELVPPYQNDFYIETLVVEDFRTPLDLKRMEFPGCQWADEFPESMSIENDEKELEHFRDSNCPLGFKFTHESNPLTNLVCDSQVTASSITATSIVKGFIENLAQWSDAFSDRFSNHLLLTQPNLDSSQPKIAFDVEKAIEDSWIELKFGVAPSISPLSKITLPDSHNDEAMNPSLMDRYWTYYDDCDRWNVVFQTLVIEPTTKSTSPGFWSEVLESTSVIEQILETTKPWFVQFLDLVEFQNLETSLDSKSTFVLNEPMLKRIPEFKLYWLNWLEILPPPANISRNTLVSLVLQSLESPLVEIIRVELQSEIQDFWTSLSEPTVNFDQNIDMQWIPWLLP